MALDDALVILVEELPAIIPRLDDEQRTALLRLLSALDSASGEGDLLDDFTDLLADILSDHPIRAALAWGSPGAAPTRSSATRS